MLTAVVTVTDDGGSSGRLRRPNSTFYPLGDIRNCMVALSEDDERCFPNCSSIACAPGTV